MSRQLEAAERAQRAAARQVCRILIRSTVAPEDRRGLADLMLEIGHPNETREDADDLDRVEGLTPGA